MVSNFLPQNIKRKCVFYTFFLESIIHTKIEEWQKNFMDDARENISKNANYLETIKEETVSLLLIKELFVCMFLNSFTGQTKEITKQHS